MKKLTLSLIMIAACSLTVTNAMAQDFTLGNIVGAILRGPGGGGHGGGGGFPGHGNPGNPGNPPGHGGGGFPGHGGGDDHHGGGDDHHGGGDHGGGGGWPGHGGGDDHHGGGGDHGGGGGWPGHGGGDHGGGGFPGNPGGQPRPVILTCESGGYNFQRCFVRGRIYRADLARQRSQSSCILGRTWGYDGNSVWVDRGCKGEFAVYLGF